MKSPGTRLGHKERARQSAERRTRSHQTRRRIANVCKRAGFTQPERRLIGIQQVPDGLEILTTSQELAHRIAREVEKAFGGRARYAWSDGDGHLLARWEAPPEPAPLPAP